MNEPPGPIERLAALAQRTDAQFGAILERQAAHVNCRAGCSHCCRARLSITRVEEAFLRRELSTLDAERRAEFSARTRQEDREMCPALDDDGRCGIYRSRPLICRSFGVPLRRRRAVELVNPPTVDVCDLNFVDTPLKGLPLEDIFDETALVEAVVALDDEYCRANDLPPGQRITIADILA